MAWQKDGHSESEKLSVLVLTAILLWSVLGLMGEVQATSLCREEAAFIVSLQGIVELRRANEVQWQQVGMDTILCAGDSIRARTHSRAALRLRNDSILRLDQKTSLTFPPAQTEPGKSLLDLFEGAIHIITRTPKPFKVRTPFVNASVDGTEFYVGLEQDTAKVVVYEGKVTASNALGSVALSDHEAAIATRDQAPRKEINIRPTDAVHWALYYPAIVDFVQDDTTAASDVVRQANHLLTAGQADEAQRLLVQALEHRSNDSDLHALLAIIAVVQNEKAQALERVTQAITLNPQSTIALMAQSYVQQAHFDIEAALESAQKVLGYNPQHALAWARVAELQMSLGQLERALEAAQQAVKLQPDLAKTQTVLGFAHLLQIDTQIAKEVFQRAIALDQADPMPRLGLGIALIREGELEQGRIQLETAASLDPANSLIRSYLGKAYFEEKRYPLASTQFDLAKERDPKDPTPWFYDAIQKQTQNRPVEALRDIQKSIELNNNRAVYRSKFLLDRDEAARGSSLARIFENLGFERRAIMETAKSLSFDPSNHSAHRFLSDTYANTPGLEFARTSELLQAQLLQPININPVQPQAAVADLNIINNTGLSLPGFNEFAPLMERSKLQMVASGIAGGNNTLGNEMVLSKLNERTSISLGQFHYETDGFRKNYDQKHNIYNLFIQHAVTSKLNVQVELRSRDTYFGELLFDGDPYDLRDNRKQSIKQDTARVGTRYSISPYQNIIASFIYSGRNASESIVTQGFDQNEKLIEIHNTTKRDQAGYIAEIQHLYNKGYINTISGFGSYHINTVPSTMTTIPGTVVPEQFQPHSSADQKKGYFYTYFNLNKKINFTAGLSYDAFNEGVDTTTQSIKFNKINPKLGLQFDITDRLRLRLAWFEVVKSTLMANQTIEPTQVAGFNQLFDDVNGTRSERKGVGFDFAASKNFYSGIEASLRNLSVPVFDSSNSIEKQKEQILRAYLYWLLHKNWSIRAEPQYEKFERNDDFLSDPNEPVYIRNLLVPVSINFFSVNGLMSSLTGTYVSQNIRRQEGYTFDAGIHDFFMLDTSLGYRLPNRKGLLSFEVRNLLEENMIYRNFNLKINEYRVSPFIPERTFFARLILNF